MKIDRFLSNILHNTSQHRQGKTMRVYVSLSLLVKFIFHVDNLSSKHAINHTTCSNPPAHIFTVAIMTTPAKNFLLTTGSLFCPESSMEMARLIVVLVLLACKKSIPISFSPHYTAKNFMTWLQFLCLNVLLWTCFQKWISTAVASEQNQIRTHQSVSD